ncbi:T9SS type A sorting domain-containing protein [Adhaeribacter aquaticus]|uniref:T9SS type A sorting domain-containing protein n=1 Tax=Adhaeribacter aquaticus TaxID=299567 RepID=UPI0004177B46|nr:T9SS type A sorting domain-containing protein [Adhaeribacter aquaticus]
MTLLPFAFCRFSTEQFSLKTLQRLFVLLLSVFIISANSASAQGCLKSGEGFNINYDGYTTNTSSKGNTITFTFKVQNTGNRALSHLTFSLPSNTTAQNPLNTNKNFRYRIENPTSSPFYGFKFETFGEGPKNGEMDVFSYTIPLPANTNASTYLTNVYPFISVEAKAGTTSIITKNFIFKSIGGCEEELDGPITALPVTLASFTGANQGQAVELKWVTATEENNSYFQVERSTDGKTFSQIGQVVGKGTTKLQQTYSFTDKAIASATYYYRLRQVDFNGAAEYSKVIAVKTNSSVTGLVKVYPNPASAALQVDLSAFASGSYQVKIASLTGTILSQQAVEAGQVTTLDIQALTSGAYLVLVQGQDLNQTKRFLKN